jgi:hypothetical protein
MDWMPRFTLIQRLTGEQQRQGQIYLPVMTGLQLPNTELLRNLLGAMSSEKKLVLFRVSWAEMSGFVVGRRFIRVEEFKCGVTSF